jgi:hypothetical protein
LTSLNLHWFQRRTRCKKFTTDDRQETLSDGKSSHGLKSTKKNNLSVPRNWYSRNWAKLTELKKQFLRSIVVEPPEFELQNFDCMNMFQHNYDSNLVNIFRY